MTDHEQGSRNVATRMVQARAALVETLAELGGLSAVDAERVARVYISKKVVKLDAVNGRYNVIHGALYDRDNIRHVLAQAQAGGQ